MDVTLERMPAADDVLPARTDARRLARLRQALGEIRGQQQRDIVGAECPCQRDAGRVGVVDPAVRPEAQHRVRIAFRKQRQSLALGLGIDVGIDQPPHQQRHQQDGGAEQHQRGLHGLGGTAGVLRGAVDPGGGRLRPGIEFGTDSARGGGGIGECAARGALGRRLRAEGAIQGLAGRAQARVIRLQGGRARHRGGRDAVNPAATCAVRGRVLCLELATVALDVVAVQQRLLVADVEPQRRNRVQAGEIAPHQLARRLYHPLAGQIHQRRQRRAEQQHHRIGPEQARLDVEPELHALPSPRFAFPATGGGRGRLS
ncbi:MAG: hypothetical protein MZV65_13050 [Chromatiales bacterium]|nr:hypothetical protein [Chromatiales bacterium]